MQQAKEILNLWVVEIKEWTPSVVCKERRKWVMVQGLPAYAWKGEIFKIMAQILGKYVGVDDSTRLKWRMDMGRVLVDVTSKEAINRAITIKINQVLYEVRLLEDPFAEEFCYMKSDRNLWDSDGSSSNDSYCVEDFNAYVDIVSEAILSATFWEDMVEGVMHDVENSNFENLSQLKAEVLGRARVLLHLQEKGCGWGPRKVLADGQSEGRQLCKEWQRNKDTGRDSE